ncbi:GNAT family N-acetyltransferase [Moheibacter sp.]|uniref:GNAT family N-acetyltransferase n=1 Tax=Moheibacter sp. TaxID=1965316 RepID=UPI003C71CDFB
MMSIEIKEIHSQRELRDFVKFQMDLYKGNPYFVPGLLVEEVNSLDVSKNPAFKHATARYFLAYKDGRIAGRIAALINQVEVNELNVKKIRFGWFDVIDDIEVTKTLFAKVEEVGRENGLKFMEGPMGATNLEKAGLLTFGFDRLATAIGQYNYDYYQKHLEELGFVKEKEWVENFIHAPETISDKIFQFANLVQERYKLKLLHFKNSKEMQPYIGPIFDLLEESYKELETYVPITEEQKAFYAKKYSTILNPDYITFIEDGDGELCAFAITMPSYAKALQKAKGRFFPFGWFHLMRAQKKNDTVEFVLIGVHPKYQRKGITSIIFKEMYETFKKHNIKYLETNPELEDNQSVQLLWKDYDPIIHKRRKTFRKEII